MAARLELTGGGRRVGGEERTRWLWRGLDLRLEAGDRLAVVGRSGSGKSLLLRALAALDALDEGRLVVCGTALDEASIPRHRARVLYLAQAPALLDDVDGRTASVLDNLRKPFDFAVHADKSFERERAVALLETLAKDASFLDAHAADLSGGERQVVAFVRAMLLAPRVLLLDEPTASLDAETTAALEGLVARWLEQDTDERAVIWTSHDAAQIERVARRRLDLGVEHDAKTSFEEADA